MSIPILLGVDWGRARVGVAVSDGLGLMAHPLATLEGGAASVVAEAVAALARERDAGSVVLGLPLNMDGTEGESVSAVRALGAALEALGLAVIYSDERLSSWQAEARLAERGLSSKKRRGRTDEAAACLILQSYLNAHRRPPSP
jgi:putative Holliday junction resolvase